MSALLTDLYQLTMWQAYLDAGMDELATFELFVRKLPAQRNFLVAAGLEQALQFLEGLQFSAQEVAWVQAQGGFSSRLLEQLSSFRFTGDVTAMPEGTVFFADEPILRITAPLPQAQFVESRLLNIVHFQTLIASKAARVALTAPHKLLVDFGMRRAHGSEAALFAARAAYLAGFAGTATAEAGRQFGIPVMGTMAHAFVQAHSSETQAFMAFARARPQRPILLIDTYDTQAAAAKVVALMPQLASEGIAIAGVRLDSGDLAAHARGVRAQFDAAHLHALSIFASGNLDEARIAALIAAGAPIDGFGVGTALVTSSDVPALDAVYKLQCYAGVPRRKRSEGKATWPGVKQVCRTRDATGRFLADRVQLASEPVQGEPLMQACLRSGQRVAPAISLPQSRAYCAAQLAALPDALRSLQLVQTRYPVVVSQAVRAAADAIDRESAERAVARQQENP